MNRKLVFEGIKPVVINRHTGVCLEKEIYTQEQLDAIHEVITDPTGYIDKSTQLRMLQESGRALDEYYRRCFPNIYSEKEEEPHDSNPLNSRFSDKIDQEEFVADSARYLDELREKQKALEIEIQKQAELSKTQNTTPSVDGGQGGLA